MKNFDYIEHVINDTVTDKTKLQFISRLINDPELRKQYHQYTKVAEEIEQQENIIKSINQNLTGYTFNIYEAANLHDIQDNQRDICRMGEDSSIIRSIIKANRPPKPGEKNGWFRAAAILSMGLLVVTSVLTAGMAAFRCCDFTIKVF